MSEDNGSEKRTVCKIQGCKRASTHVVFSFTAGGKPSALVPLHVCDLQAHKSQGANGLETLGYTTKIRKIEIADERTEERDRWTRIEFGFTLYGTELHQLKTAARLLGTVERDLGVPVHGSLYNSAGTKLQIPSAESLIGKE